MNDLRVLIVADDPLVRAGLAALLAEQAECDIIGQVPEQADLEDAVGVYQPDVILWDLGWDPPPGPSLLQGEGEYPASVFADIGVPIVALLPDEANAADAWASGAQGLLLREVEVSIMVSAVHAVAQGLVVLDPTLAGAIFPGAGEPPRPQVEDLTPRESEVLQLLAEGLPNKTIALQLGISDHTVKFHVNAILGKLGAQSRTEAVVRATRLGLIVL